MRALQESIDFFDSLTPKTFGVIANIMDSRKKLRNARIVMLLVGLVMDVAWIAPLVYGVVTGTWWPFAIGLCIAIVLGVLISRFYITHTAYVCPEDHTVFRPPLLENLFARHTLSMRKLTCPTCGNKLFCLEVYVPDTMPRRAGKYFIWNSARE